MKHLNLALTAARRGAFVIAAVQLASCGSHVNDGTNGASSGVIAPFPLPGGLDGNGSPMQDGPSMQDDASGAAEASPGTDRPAASAEGVEPIGLVGAGGPGSEAGAEMGGGGVPPQ